MTKHVAIDWARVERAARRGKQGRFQPGDFELVLAAFTADPRRYSALKCKVDAEVDAEMRKYGSSG